MHAQRKTGGSSESISSDFSKDSQVSHGKSTTTSSSTSNEPPSFHNVFHSSPPPAPPRTYPQQSPQGQGGGGSNNNQNPPLPPQSGGNMCSEEVQGNIQGGEEIQYLSGEKLHRVNKDVTHLCPFNGPVKGNLFLTNYRLYFACSKDRNHSFEIPLGVINRLQKVGGVSSRGENSYGIEIFCKDIRNHKFAHNPENHSRREFYDELNQLAFPFTKKSLPFAFSYTEKFPEDGWSVYEPILELRRLGVPNESWKITKINEKYEMCDSYPNVWAIPTAATEEDIKSVMSFRTRNRLPILSWLHPISYASLTRSSQPMVGMASKRNREDEKYLQIILDANAHAHKLYVMDARPNANALANKAKGGGYESEDIYQNIELIFLDIHNIHVMRESLRRLREECFPAIDDIKWYTEIENTKWLEHLKCIISGAVRIVDKIENQKTSVLVHCSDGWDRTSQLTALSMLLMDSYYRTLRGFQVLLEKEWISFGHKFQNRVGHGDDRYSDGDRSPVFLQWVDSVYQVTLQFPYAFEFNEYFLITLLDHLYSCLFGTFLYNTEKERALNEVKKRTNSFWSLINSKKDSYINPFYNTDNYQPGKPGKVLVPSPAIRHMKIWKRYFCRWTKLKCQVEEPDWAKYQKLQAFKVSLEKRYAELKIEAESRNHVVVPFQV